MTRTMYDSVNPGAIPPTAAMVAGYVDGRYAWKPADWTRFPTAVKVRIAVSPSTNDGHVLDCETGDATPAQCPGWVVMRRKAGADPTVYCAQSQWPAVQAAFTAAGVAQPHYWIAAYPGARDNAGNPMVPAGAVAHQYVDPPNSGGDWDLSVVADHWPGVDVGPNVTPDGGFLMALADWQQERLFDRVLSMSQGVDGQNFDGAQFGWEKSQFAAIQAQLAAIQGTLSTEEADLLAAIKAIPAATVDVGALAKAFADGGLPAELVSALLAVLSKAAA